MSPKTIGFIGNFEPYFSTENDRLWSLVKLGHTVVTFQENKTSKDDLTAWLSKLDGLFYSHTHGWEIQGLKEVFSLYKKKGVPTASVHLDRWAWLERESDIGKEATWFAEFQFMADASPEAVELYKKHNLKWFYIKPAVVERDCYMSPPDFIRFPHEVVFIGSKGYHKEYPFRANLIEFLHNTYKEKFGHYGNDGLGVVRGHDLNVLCSTAKIVVGDSCFGGRPNYVSDRYYEIRGRGGFLLHPQVEGVDYNGVGFYEAGNLDDVKKQVDYWLAEDNKRQAMRFKGFSHVKHNETYTHRMSEIIGILYGN